MIIIIGLGNPGEKFKNTRHNIGFLAVDKIASNFQFSIFNFSTQGGSASGGQSISNAEISKGEISGEKVILVKPQTFMNESGKSIKTLTTHYKLPTTNLIVIHDDVDLPVGKIKIVKNRGSAGHKGVKSIIKAIGSKNFVRIRIGIKPAQFRVLDNKTIKANAIVLKKFSKEEKEIIDQALEKTCQILKCLIECGLEKTMNEYNK